MLHRFFKIVILTAFGAGMFLFSAYNTIPDGIYSDPQQAQKAFIQLNKVRKDPNAYTERYHVEMVNIPSAPALIWNDTLAIVAENCALDMAQKSYFGGVDRDGYGSNYYINKAGYRLDAEWLKHKKAHDFEAIDGGSQSGETAIAALIMDKNNSSLDERKLLLGMGSFNAGLHDVGIAFVHGTKYTKYRTYTVVIITSHHPPAK